MSAVARADPASGIPAKALGLGSLCCTSPMRWPVPTAFRTWTARRRETRAPVRGDLQSSVRAYPAAALVGAGAMNAGFKIGYSLAPGWTYQWRSIQHHLTRLGEQYRGVRLLGNVDVEETVHALFLDLYHLYDWLHQDSTLQSLDNATVKTFIDQHPDSLGLCRDYANTRKHVTRTRPGERIALIISIEVVPGSPGFTVMIGHRPWDQPTLAMTEVDALALAEQSEQDWRDLLTQHHVAILL
jgi:hypothetical protein